jgi:hypothetical protein
MLPTGIKRSATAAIAAFDRAYFAEGGLAELTDAVAQERESLSAIIFRLAVRCRKAEKNLADAASLFRAACGYAEDGYKQEHGIKSITERMPAWSQFKSRLLRAMKHGVDPAKYKSEKAVREALAESLRRKTPVPKPEGEAREGPPPPAPERIGEWLDTTGVHSTLQFALSRIVLEAEYIRPAKRKEAERILLDAAKALSNLVDKRRITDDATKAALADVAQAA